VIALSQGVKTNVMGQFVIVQSTDEAAAAS
jgi:hypothetical protein